MFKNIMVPLDGSDLAASAIPAAAHLASAIGAHLTLFHAIEQNPPKQVHHQPHLTDPHAAADYLESIAVQLPPDLPPPHQHVHVAAVDDVGQSIAEHAVELGIDLIVMCTHGRRGLRRWVLGSIAQQVIAAGRTPVLIIPARRAPATTFSCGRMLLPLDGDPAHEQPLPLATDMAQACSAELWLLTVVPTASHMTGDRVAAAQVLPATMANLLDIEKTRAADHLAALAKDLARPKIQLHTLIRRGKPATQILRAATELHADLIVLATHRKMGMEAFWSASVAPWVLQRSKTPVLLIPLND